MTSLNNLHDNIQQAFDSLTKNITKSMDEITKQKLKVGFCVTITELVCKSNEKKVLLPSFAITFLLQLLEDADSNSRLIIDENVNKIIRNSLGKSNHVPEILIGFLKVLRNNTSERPLKAALWRFAQLSHFIRPQKGKLYVKTLMPIIIKLSERKEEMIHETLKESLPCIFENIGLFTTDKDIKSLLKVFFRNLNSESVEVRRSAACCIVTMFYPVGFLHASKSIEKLEKTSVQGCLFCVYQILSHFIKLFLRERLVDDNTIPEKFLQIYELSLYFAKFNDHNIVTAALETLHQLLQQENNKFTHMLTVKNSLAESSFVKAEKYGSTLSLSNLSDISSFGSTLFQAEDSLFCELRDSAFEETTPNIDSKECQMKNWVDHQEPSDDNSIFSSSLSIDISHFANSDDENTSKNNDLSVHSQFYDFENRTDDLHSPRQSMCKSSSIANISGISNSTSLSIVTLDLDIGDIFDEEDIPLNYCARFLLSMFLVENIDRNVKPVRVSVKSLSLKCLTQLMKIHPRCGLISLEKSDSMYKDYNNLMEIILQLASDEDHQIRGIVRLVIGNFIKSSLYVDCYLIDVKNIRILNEELLAKLIKVILQGLEDESSQCIKYSLNAVSVCLALILQTPLFKLAIPLLEKILQLVDNPYWLIKTTLLEMTDDLCYELLHFISDGNNSYQDRILEKIILVLLSDPDGRVRTTSAKSLSKFVARSYHVFDHQFIPVFVSYVTKMNSSLLEESRRSLIEQRALQRIIHRLYKILINSSCKDEIAGCCEALYVLVSEYQPLNHPVGWQFDYFTINTRSIYSPLNLLEYLLSLLTSSSIALNFDVHLFALKVTSQLFSALCRKDIASNKKEPFIEESNMWSFFTNNDLRSFAESYLQHLTRLSNVFNDIIVGTHVESITSVENFDIPVVLPLSIDELLSIKPPSQFIVRCKKQPLSKEHNWKSERSYSFAQYNHLRVYMELRNILEAAFANYNVTLKPEASEKFVKLLNALLESFGVVLEYTTITEVGRICKNVLLFLRNVSVFSPAHNVRCVTQLLKSIFGTNSTSEYVRSLSEFDEIVKYVDHSPSVDFYVTGFQEPYENLKTKLNSKDTSTFAGITPGIKKGSSVATVELLPPPKQVKRIGYSNMLPSYTKLFKPNVIHSLQQYTVTSDAELQSEVLSLLSALIQARVNYYFLDPEQVFINFVLSQFQLMEEERLTDMDKLLPSMFNFLIHLASEKHSKPMMTVPKIIQLCDLLIASIQATSYCVIAIELVTRHVFTRFSVLTNSSEIKELETQRDVLFAMLLKLICNYQTFPLLSLILDNSDEESSLKRSNQIIDVYFNALEDNKIFSGDENKIASCLENLFLSLHPASVDAKRLWNVILTVYSSNYVRDSSQWLHVVGSLLIVLLRECDESRLLTVVESFSNHPALIDQTSDPLCVGTGAKNKLSPEKVFTRFLFQYLQQILKQIVNMNEFSKNSDDLYRILRLFSDSLLTTAFMSQSGYYDKIKIEILQIYNGEADEETECCILDIRTMMDRLLVNFPVVHLKWFAIFGCNNKSGENEEYQDNLSVLIINNLRNSFTSEILKHGMFLLVCKFEYKSLISNMNFLRKFLEEHLQMFLANLGESVVCNLLSSITASKSASCVFLHCLQDFYTSVSENKCKVLKILHCFRYCSVETSGQQLLFYFQKNLPNHLNTVIAFTVLESMTCILKKLKAVNCKEKFDECMSMENIKFILECSSQPFNSNMKKWYLSFHNLVLKWDIMDMVDANDENDFKLEQIASTRINEEWFFEILRNRCCTVDEIRYSNMASMMRNLSLKRILEIQQAEEFNRKILRYCILVGSQITEQKWNSNPDDLELSDMFVASRTTLLSYIKDFNNQFPNIHKVYIPFKRDANEEEVAYKRTIDQLFAVDKIRENIKNLIPIVRQYLTEVWKFLSKTDLTHLIPSESFSEFLFFVVKSFEFIHWCNRNSRYCHKSLTLGVLECAGSVLRIEEILAEMKSAHIGTIISCICYVMKIFSKDVLNIRSNPILDDIEDDSNGLRFSVHVVSTLIEFIINKNADFISSNQFFKYLKNLLIMMSRSPLIYNYIRIPLEVWKHASKEDVILEECLGLNTISEHYLQDCDILKNFISRFIFSGWKCRQQFEETWMTLLISLNSLPEQDISEVEFDALSQLHSISISAVTSLLVQTLYYPSPGDRMSNKVFHVSRNSLQFRQSEYMSKLCNISYDLKLKAATEDENVFSLFDKVATNLERLHDGDRFGFNQISIDYLLSSIESPNVTTEESSESISLYRRDLHSIRKRRLQSIERIGIDTNSCIYFLMDYYSRWLLKSGTQSFQVFLEAVNSLAVISDLFVEISQFAWLTECCLLLWKRCSKQNDTVCAYLILLICKASSICVPKNTDSRMLVIKILKFGLDSLSPFVRSVSSQGLLYLLENIFIKRNVSDRLETIEASFREDILSVCVRFILENLDVDSIETSDERTTCCVVSVACYVIENKAREDITNSLIDRLFKLSVRACKLNYWKTYITVIQGLYNLILLNDDSIKCYNNELNQLVKEILSTAECTSAVSICSLQMLTALIYTSDHFEKTRNETIDELFDTDELINKTEKISVFFHRIKKSEPFEARIIATLLTHILCDFYTAPEILNKVILEVLSPQQRYCDLLAEIVFHVFQNAIKYSQLDLITDWVLSISNNFTNYSTPKAEFFFILFFISASNNQWLTASFPLLSVSDQQNDVNYKKMFLYLSAVQFYLQLENDEQRKKLTKTLNDAGNKHLTSPFRDVCNVISAKFSNESKH